MTDPPAVLVVEDNAEIRATLCAVLRGKGYDVTEAADGAAALDAASRGGPFRLLVTDVIMPGMNGKQLHDRLAQAQPGLRVIYITGYVEQAFNDLGLREGEDAFLAKPFRPYALMEKVREVLNRPEAPPSA